MQVPGISLQRRCVYFSNLYLRKALKHLPPLLLQGRSQRPCAVLGSCTGLRFLPVPVGREVQALGCAIPVRNASDRCKMRTCKLFAKLTTPASCGLMSSFPGLAQQLCLKPVLKPLFLKEAQNPLTMLGVTLLPPRADSKGGAWQWDLQHGVCCALLSIFLY